ncbi:MAG: DUF5674 family protein [Clostridiales Family XIII bacterium]|jgi:hypothetical protein|nr:DUF5674 family protein [Clostridiales Family XIII bacterium]
MKIADPIHIEELRIMSENMYNPLVKAVVDVRRRILVVDAEMHADEEAFLLEGGSAQSDLWGINLWPEEYGTEDFVEFDSMINLRPRDGNRSRSVDDTGTQALIRQIVAEKIHA